MIELTLPSFGADMEDAVFVEWRVQPGQPVQRGDVVCVVETQKGAIDVEAWQAGTVARLLAEPGQTLPVGQALARLADEGEDWQAVAAAPAAAPEPEAAPAPSAAPSPEPATASATEPPPAPLPPRVPPGPPRAPGMRAAIAAAMARSKREIPHYYLRQEMDVEPALAWLEAANAALPPARRILFAALALKAVALALRQTPQLVGRLVDGRFEPAAAVHVGMVTALRGGGLVVPTVHDAHHLPLPALMEALADVLARARRGSLRSSDLADSTVTLTQLGDLGADSVHGVIYPPQVAIVGLGRVAVRPWVRGGQVLPSRTVHATVAGDHRVSDGLVGARFLGLLADHLMHPEAL